MASVTVGIDPDKLRAMIENVDKSLLPGYNQQQQKNNQKDYNQKDSNFNYSSGKKVGSMVENDLNEIKSGRFSGIFEGKKDVISNYQETKKQNDEKMKEHKNKLETVESRIDKLGSNSGLGTGGAASERSLQVLKVEKLEVSQMQGQNGQAFSGGDRNAGGMFSSSSKF